MLDRTRRIPWVAARSAPEVEVEEAHSGVFGATGSSRRVAETFIAIARLVARLPIAE